MKKFTDTMKFTQIAIVPATAQDRDPVVVALREDGTIWLREVDSSDRRRLLCNVWIGWDPTELTKTGDD